ncbi:MAG: hypothetical protein ACKVPX_14845 [Myxococcaceae bacterium]
MDRLRPLPATALHRTHAVASPAASPNEALLSTVASGVYRAWELRCGHPFRHWKDIWADLEPILHRFDQAARTETLHTPAAPQAQARWLEVGLRLCALHRHCNEKTAPALRQLALAALRIGDLEGRVQRYVRSGRLPLAAALVGAQPPQTDFERMVDSVKLDWLLAAAVAARNWSSAGFLLDDLGVLLSHAPLRALGLAWQHTPPTTVAEAQAALRRAHVGLDNGGPRTVEDLLRRASTKRRAQSPPQHARAWILVCRDAFGHAWRKDLDTVRTAKARLRDALLTHPDRNDALREAFFREPAVKRLALALSQMRQHLLEHSCVSAHEARILAAALEINLRRVQDPAALRETCRTIEELIRLTQGYALTTLTTVTDRKPRRTFGADTVIQLTPQMPAAHVRRALFAHVAEAWPHALDPQHASLFARWHAQPTPDAPSWHERFIACIEALSGSDALLDFACAQPHDLEVFVGYLLDQRRSDQ